MITDNFNSGRAPGKVRLAYKRKMPRLSRGHLVICSKFRYPAIYKNNQPQNVLRCQQSNLIVNAEDNYLNYIGKNKSD